MMLDGEGWKEGSDQAFEITGVTPGIDSVDMFEGEYVPEGEHEVTHTPRLFLIIKQRGKLRTVTFYKLALMTANGDLDLIEEFDGTNGDDRWALRWRLPVKNLLRSHCGKPQAGERLDFNKLKADAQSNYPIDNEQVIALCRIVEDSVRAASGMAAILKQRGIDVFDLSFPHPPDALTDYPGTPINVQTFLDWLDAQKSDAV